MRREEEARKRKTEALTNPRTESSSTKTSREKIKGGK